MIKKIKDFWTASIKRQIILGIVLVHAVMMSLFVIDLVQKERDFLNEQHNKNAKSLSKSLASSSIAWFLAKDYIGLEEVISSFKHYPGINFLMIVDTQGQVVAHTDKKYLGKYLSDAKSISMLKSDAKTQTIFENSSEIDMVSPLLRDKQHIGWARLSLSKKEINEGLYNVTLNGVGYTVLAILIGVVFGYLMSTGITRDLYKILHTIKGIKDGDPNIRTLLNRHDEIGVVSNEFDNMIDVVQKSKEELRIVNERHELSLEGVQDGIWDWNIVTDDAYFSKRWKNMLGYNEDEVGNNGEAFMALLHKDDLQKVKDTLALHFNDPVKNKYSIEIRLLCKDGKYKWILARGNVILDEDHKPIRMLGYHSDISKEKEHEVYKQKQDKIMQEQAKLASMGEMIGNIAHQWRQPLSVISTGATGLRVQKEYETLTDELFYETCDSINENAQYLSKTIDDFKEFIMGDRDKVSFSLSHNIESFLHLVEGTIKNNEIIIQKDFQFDGELRGYPNELNQCFLNIFNNSKDAFLEVDHPRVFKIHTYQKGKNIIVKFYDTAGGILEDILPHVFEPYFTTKYKSKGTGLGLSMAYRIVVQGMEGSIHASNHKFEFENKKYPGACFTITLSMDEN
jgi:PAS domain S-box-containing protein